MLTSRISECSKATSGHEAEIALAAVGSSKSTIGAANYRGIKQLQSSDRQLTQSMLDEILQIGSHCKHLDEFGLGVSVSDPGDGVALSNALSAHVLNQLSGTVPSAAHFEFSELESQIFQFTAQDMLKTVCDLVRMCS